MFVWSQPGTLRGIHPLVAHTRRRILTLDGAMLTAIVVMMAVVAWQLASMRSPVSQDDAYIAFRYAQNLARGSGPVFNYEERVWGYTSPLEVFVLGFLGRLGFDIPKAELFFAVAANGLSAWLAFRVTAHALGRRAGLFVGVLFLSSGFTFTFMGLETPWVSALLWSYLALASAGERPIATGFVAALACLARPDSLLLVLPVLALTPGLRRPRTLVAFAVPGLCWELFCWRYYGHVLPNSFYAKAHGLSGNWTDHLREGLEYTMSLTKKFAYPMLTGQCDDGACGTGRCGGGACGGWMIVSRSLLDQVSSHLEFVCGGVMALAAIGPAMLLFSRRMRRPQARPLLVAVAFYPWAIIGAYAYIRPPWEHSWEYWNGLMFLLVGMLLTLACVAGFRLRASRLSDALLAVGLAAIFFLGAKKKAESVRASDDAYWLGNQHRLYSGIGEWLRAHGATKDTQVEYGEPGTIAYAGDIRVYDNFIVSRGLLSPPDYVLSRDLVSDPRHFRWYGSTTYHLVQSFPASGWEPLYLFKKE